MGETMALYKNFDYLEPSTHQEFDRKHSPGAAAPHAGIYRCVGCGDEIGIAKGHTLPPQNHHRHSNIGVPVQWQLLMCAVQR